ncbi:MAG: hypothetical protein KBC78_02005 [Candidatus Pacebacteria bacterium]|nr:hypothetical protein [Candidatus Paceibacterota bacterium]
MKNKYHTKIFCATQNIFSTTGILEHVYVQECGKTGDELKELMGYPVGVVFAKEEMVNEVREGQFILFIKKFLSQEEEEDMSRTDLSLYFFKETKSPSYHAYISDKQIKSEDFDKDDLENMPIFREHTIDFLVKSSYIKLLDEKK